MSVVNCIRAPEGLALFTDGAAYDDSGAVVAIASKVIILPFAAMSSRGKFSLLPLLYAATHACSTFEALLTTIEANAQIVDDTSEVMICGYSRDRGVFEIYVLPGHQNYSGVGFPKRILTRIAGNCFLPGPNPATAEEMNWKMPELQDFDADRDGVKLMECQRRDRQEPYGFCCGGFVQRTDITREGINSRIVRWWPDEVGRWIAPDRDDFKKSRRHKFLETTAVPYARARLYGLIAGVPDAMKAAVSAAKTGMQTPLPGELAQNIIPKRNKNIPFQQPAGGLFSDAVNPIPGPLGTVIGVPSRFASGIHSFYNFLGYRASIEAQAYRAAKSEGLKLNDDAFWQRRQALADSPTVEMMNAGIDEGYRGTFISELGDTGKAVSGLVNKVKLFQLVMPFTHIPLNILSRALEGTPAAFLDAETRAELTGAKGAVKQDTAIARMVAGGAIGAWAVNQVLNDRMTGFGPSDPKERAQWMATGHAPYSIRIGDYWYSFNRFGSLGTMLGLYANLSEIIPHMTEDDADLYKAIGMVVHSTGRLIEDEVGMQGLAGLMDAINDPGRYGSRYVSNFAGSLLPFSSLQRQVASSMDPYMRETKGVVEGLRYYIPVAREGLQPKRDWLGAPISNAGYGGDLPVPGLSSIIQHRDARPDPLALEMQALDLHPAAPTNRINGVKLPPKLYDIYQATAGPLTRTALEAYINQPGWHDIPASVRQDIFKNTIESAHQTAGAAMQMRYPQLIQQGVDQTIARIKGEKPPKMQDVPSAGPPLDHGSHSEWRDVNGR